MIRTIIYIVLLATVFYAPVQSADVGKLQPVEVVYVRTAGSQILVETDTGDVGRGKDVATAIKNLKETTPAIVYLDTAQYLLVTNDTLRLLGELAKHLKTNIQVCLTQGRVDLKDASAYLRVHGDLPLLRTINNPNELPVLRQEKNTEKVENNA